MSNLVRFRSLLHLGPAMKGVPLAVILLAMIFLASPPAPAQNFNVIHAFTGNGDGESPYAGVLLDTHGNLFGTTTLGRSGDGSVFRMSLKNSAWVLNTLYNFTGTGNDGAYVYSEVITDRSGELFGTTVLGGASQEGTVFKLQPLPARPASIIAPWHETTLHSFAHNGSDGVGPFSSLVFDPAGNLYGTTIRGGDFYDGTVFLLTPAHGSWTESVLYSFAGGDDGVEPQSGVVLDSVGNLYGTTTFGGASDCGTVYRLAHSGSTWTESILYTFQGNGDGCHPQAGVILDSAGNLYGATLQNTTNDLSGGTVFELSPAGDRWSFNLLYTFSSPANGGVNACGRGSGPASSLTMDSSGALYGTTQANGIFGYGNVFQLSPGRNGWMYTSLHDFSVFTNGGASPCGGVTIDHSGNLYGTTLAGGVFPYSNGVVWEIAP